MTPLKTGIAAACFFLSPMLHAQADTAGLHDAKMQMIRAAVNFYSEDKTLSKKPVDCKSVDVPGLKACANRMFNVDKKIDKWNSTPVRDEAGLQQLGSTILDDITHKKPYREQLPAYGAFMNEIRQLSSSVSETPAETPDAPDTDPAPPPRQEPVPIYKPASETLTLTDAPPAPVVTALQAPAQASVSVWQGPLIWSVAALLVAVLALIVAFLARQSGRNRKHRSVPDDAGAAQAGIAALQRKVSELETELRKIRLHTDDAEQAVHDKLRQLEAKHAGPRPAEQQVAIPNAPFPVSKRWAKNVDGGGFDLDALSPEPDSKMIYEITQTGRNAATYRVSETREAQLFALSNPQNYLREGCIYTTQPAPNSQIRTEAPGTLELDGRKWRIKSQAQIAFS